MSSCLSMLEYPKVKLSSRFGVAFSVPLHHKNMWGEGGGGGDLKVKEFRNRPRGFQEV
jgi:hypothetical protein